MTLKIIKRMSWKKYPYVFIKVPVCFNKNSRENSTKLTCEFNKTDVRI